MHVAKPGPPDLAMLVASVLPTHKILLDGGEV